jgi:exopolysaccharide biosynthesis polyprenyl glycosylphosphotransferase
MDRRTLLRYLLGVCDATVLGLSFAASFWLRRLLFDPNLASFTDYTWLLWVIVPAWLVALSVFGLYHSASYESRREIAVRMIKAQMLAGLMLLSTMFLTKSGEISRLLLQTFIGTSMVALTIQKLAVGETLRYLRRRKGAQIRQVLVICNASRGDAYSRVLREHASWYSEVVGFLMPEADDQAQLPALDKPVLGTPARLPQVLLTHVVDEVVVVQPFGSAETEQISRRCAERGLTLRIMIELPSLQMGSYLAQDLGQGVYFLSVEAVSLDALRLAAKRLIDLAGATVGLCIFAVAYVIYRRRLRAESGGSPIFRQRRVGKNGRRFTIYKFRTMVHDAEARLKELRDDNVMRGPLFKVPDDPRITATGRALRRRHLDELPQFWNVLRGDMSLVGTRPPTENETTFYDDHHYKRLSIKPGLTGLWQVSGNSAVNDFEEVVKLDCTYIDKWSLSQDVRIIAATVRKMLRADAW